MRQRDPLNEYKSEAFELFDNLIGHLREQVTAQLMRVEVMFAPPEEPALPPDAGVPYRPMTGVDEFAAAGVGERAAAALGFSHDGRAAAGPRSQRPVDLGQRRPQRGLPVRLRQEIQALPRPDRLISSFNGLAHWLCLRNTCANM